MQVCPHCGARISARPARETTGSLLAAGARELVRRAPTWWGIFLVPTLVVEAASWAAVLASPDLAALLAGCGAAPAGGPAVYLGIVPLVLLTFAAYFAGWARVAAAHAGAAVAWKAVLLGSLLLSLLFVLGLALLVVPAVLFFWWFLPAPVALGRGARPLAALETGREIARRLPASYPLVLLLVFLVAEGAQLAASCTPGLAGSLAAQALVWWAFAPIVPVFTAVAFSRLAGRAP